MNIKVYLKNNWFTKEQILYKSYDNPHKFPEEFLKILPKSARVVSKKTRSPPVAPVSKTFPLSEVKDPLQENQIVDNVEGKSLSQLHKNVNTKAV